MRSPQESDPKPRLCTSLRAGDIFGELAAFGDTKRTTTVTATSTCMCAVLPDAVAAKEKLDEQLLTHLEMQKQYYVYANRLLRFTDLTWVADLGQGGFGTVVMMRDTRDNTPVALKVMRRCRIRKPKHQQNLLAEKRALELLRHPFIVRLFSTFKDDVRLSALRTHKLLCVYSNSRMTEMPH